MKVDEDSKKLLIINTHEGLFRYNCLPFSEKLVPTIFQQTLIGVATFIADIIVAGATQDEFLKRLFFVFKRIQQYGFHVGGRKMPIFWTSIKYLDSIFDKNCRQLNRKIFLHQNTSAKADISTLRSFLVMVIHYRSFCENPSVFEFP